MIVTPLIGPVQAAGPTLQFFSSQSAALDACIADTAQLNTGCIPNTPSFTAWCKSWGAFNAGPNLTAFYGVVQEFLPSPPYYYCLTPLSTTGPGYAWPTNSCAAGTQFVGPTGYDCVTPTAATLSEDSQKQAGKGVQEGGACTKYGNPCDASTGNKLQIETDFAGGDGIPDFVRYYNSLDFSNSSRIGASWMHNQMRFMVFGTGNPPTLTLVRGDGQRESFTSSSGGIWVGQADTRRRVTKTADGYTVQHPDGSDDAYSIDGRLLTDKDRFGRVTTYTYVSGVLNRITGPYGHKIIFTGRSNGWAVTFPNGWAAIYTYDATSNLTTIQYQDSTYGFGTTRTFKYENAALPHALTGIVDELGNRATTYAYDAAAGKAVRTEQAGGVRRFDFSYGANQTTVTDAAGNARVLTFQRNLDVNNLASRTDPDGKSFSQTFDGSNNLLSKTDEEGRTTTYGYDGANRPVIITEASGTPQARTTSVAYADPFLDMPAVITGPSVRAGEDARTIVVYNAQKLPAQITRSGFDPAGNPVSRTIDITYTSDGHVATVDGPRTDVADVTSFDYWLCTTGGKCGQLKSITNALGQVTTFDTYTNGGLISKKTGATGLVTTYAYDFRDRLLTLTETPVTGNARTTAFTYNKSGDVLTASLPGGTVLAYAYTAAHDLASITDSLGNKVSYTYDLRGNRIKEKVIDSAQVLARQVDLTFDIRNRVATINRGSSLTQTVFDAVGNLTSVTDPNGHASTNNYDPLNRIILSVNALGGNTSLSYDATDRASSITSPNGATWALTHDDLGNELSEASPDRGTAASTFDAAGNTVSRTDARNITAARTYDALNRLASISYPLAGEDVTYTYDTCVGGLGQLCGVTDATGSWVYAYDGFGRVTGVSLTTLSHVYTTNYTWTPADKVATVTYPTGRMVSYTRNNLGRITAITTAGQNIVSARNYRPDGLLKAQTYGNGLVDARSYDLQGRLVRWTTGSTDSRTYTYDENGNILLINSAGYVYDWLDRLVSEPSQPFTYDPNGNRLQDLTGAYTYTGNSNRMASNPSGAVTIDAAGNTTMIGAKSFSYNQAGRLASASVSGVPAGLYAYAFDGHRARKVAGATTTVFHYDLEGRMIAETDAAGAALSEYVRDDEGRPLAQISGGTTTFLHPDHLGSPRFGTNASKTVVWQWSGNAFGETPPIGSVTINLRHPGQFFDKETNTNYNYFRDYDPSIGRYLQSDPIGLQGGINTYSYVGGNPMSRIDPLGLYYPSDPNFPYTPPSPPSSTPSGSSSALQCSCDDKYKVSLRCFIITVDFTVPQSVPSGGWSLSWIGVGPSGLGGKGQLVKVCKCVSDDGWYVGLKGTGSAGAGPVGVEASGTVQFYPPGYQGSVSGSSSTAGYATPGLSGQVGIGR